MASSKREFVNFKDFAGKINEGTNNYEFPLLYKLADTGKMRQWGIYIRLIKEASKNPTKTKKQNWNLLLEDQVPIKKSYLMDDIIFPEGILAQVWTESGFVDMKISRSAPIYTNIKNKGKKNERNVFHQALVIARSKYIKKLEEGANTIDKISLKESKKIKDKKFFPMLAKNINDVKNITYPVYVQPKLDGLRCISYLDKNPDETKNISEDDVILYSRQKKEYPTNSSTINIKMSLLNVLINYYDNDKKESLYFDGELYKHGKSLQNINSATRGTVIDAKGIEEYHIYDMFYPSYTNQTFEERTKLLEKIYTSLKKDENKYIKLVPTYIVKNKEENDKIYTRYINENYEGIMIRNIQGKYAKSSIKKSSSLRSKDLLKRKEVFDGEYEVINYTDGTGKDSGAIVWICITKEGKEFKVVPNISYNERYKIYKECKNNFIKKYKNRLLHIEYRSLSNDNVPQHSRAINFRDYE